MANQYVNKVVVGGVTKLDLTGDTATAEKVLSGFTFHDKSGAPVEGTCDFDVDSQDATVAVGEILSGKTAYARGTKLTGSMPNNGAKTLEIDDKDDELAIVQGYHDGSGKAKIKATEKAKLIPENIRENVTVLGVTGTMSGSEDVHAQAKSVTPSFQQQSIQPDSPDYNYLSSVTVAAIPVTETDNSAGGKTLTVG